MQISHGELLQRRAASNLTASYNSDINMTLYHIRFFEINAIKTFATHCSKTTHSTVETNISPRQPMIYTSKPNEMQL